jgi:hypothetical protein
MNFFSQEVTTFPQWLVICLCIAVVDFGLKKYNQYRIGGLHKATRGFLGNPIVVESLKVTLQPEEVVAYRRWKENVILGAATGSKN